MFKFHRNEPPSRLCRVLRSPLDWDQKVENFFQDLFGPLYRVIFTRKFFQADDIFSYRLSKAANTFLYRKSFFAGSLEKPLDLIFIDGMVQ